MPLPRMSLRAYDVADILLAYCRTSDFAYLVYPFTRIFKLTGYLPVKLRLGDEPATKCERVEWDLTACLWTFAGAVAYFVGFIIGIQHLSMTEDFRKLRENSIIAFYTSWAQILTLFVLGAVTVISSWVHMSDQRDLIQLIFRIDQHLRTVVDTKVDYTSMRKRFFVEFFTAFLVPTVSSMVNCVVIQPRPEAFSLLTTCFWFICFAPIMLITFKEFQFFTLLLVLKSKFHIVNNKLRLFSDGPRRIKVLHFHKVLSSSEIPLTAVPVVPINGHGGSDCAEEPNVKALHRLLEIYSLTADAVHLVLKIFAWHLVFLTSISIGVITIQSYNLFTLIAHSVEMEPHQVVFIVIWIMVQILAIGINVSACNMTSDTMAHTGPLLHKLRIETGSECAVLFYQTLQLFSLEVLQRKNNFTAAGFFDINYKLITSIIAAVTTYLVIIIQFHLTNIPDVHFHEKPK